LRKSKKAANKRGASVRSEGVAGSGSGSAAYRSAIAGSVVVSAAAPGGGQPGPDATANPPAPAKKQGWLRKHGITLVLVAALLAGLGMLAYPSFSNWWNEMHQSQAIMDYQNNVSQMNAKEYKKILKAAQDYNKRLAQTGQQWRMTDAQTKEYNSLLNADGSGIMGYIQIPKINVQLPIYHGTDDSVLQTSIGHLAGTSLPVGGKGSHCVLSGHRGLPSARLFTDLDKLVEGDTFTLTVLNKTLTYQVDQIRIVEPNDISDLQIEPGKDYCTLVTCTPYGINTQRLLVRGHRILNPNGDAQILAEAIQIRPLYVVPFVAAPVLAVLIAYVLITTRRRPTDVGVEAAYLGSRGLHRPHVDIPDHGEIADAVREFVNKVRRR
jgi:sortase A